MTPVEQPAKVRQIGFGADQSICCDVQSARARAGSFAGGGAPSTRRTPKRGFGGSNASWALIIMRATMPSGARV